MHLFRQAGTTEGYPLFGLFTYEGLNPKVDASCGVVYFASASMIERLKERSKKDDDLKMITSGIDSWPIRREY